MDISISNKPAGILLSSALPDIALSVLESSFADVRLTAPDSSVIFDERLYAVDGRVWLCDLASLVESDLCRLGESFGAYLLEAGSKDAATFTALDSVSLWVLYCDRFGVCSDIEAFLVENFLTTLPVRRIAPAEPVALSMWVHAGDSLRVDVAATLRNTLDGSVWPVSLILSEASVSARDGVAGVSLSQQQLLALAPASAPSWAWEVVSFSLAAGHRVAQFFVDGSLDPAESFYFRSCFNVWERASLPIATKAKTKAEVEQAVIRGSAVQYDRRITREFESKLGPLSADEAAWVDQLCTSPDVARVIRDEASGEESPVAVLVTEVDCDIDQHPDSPNSVKLTWRFAVNRPDVRLRMPSGIFTEHYNTAFS